MREDTVQHTMCQRAEWVGVEVLFLPEGTAREGHDFCKKYDLLRGEAIQLWLEIHTGGATSSGALHAVQFGLVLLHGDSWWTLSGEMGVTHTYILER